MIRLLRGLGERKGNSSTCIKCYLDNLNFQKNLYHSLFRLGFKFVVHQLGQGVIVKPFLYYEKSSKSIEFKKAIRERKQKVDKVTIKEKRAANKLEIWQECIYEVAMILKLTDEEAYAICGDSSMRRYFLNYFKNGRGLS